MRASRQGREGMALILVILAVIVILGAITLVATRVQTAKLRTDRAVTQARLEETCKAGVDIAIARLWYDYVVGNGNTTGNLASYRVFINTLVPNNEDLNGNGTKDAGESDSNGNGTFESNPAGVDFIREIDNRTLGTGEQIVRVNVTRTDDIAGSFFTIASTGRVGNQTQTSTQTVRVSGQLFTGFEYCILANNVNCILCHARFQPLDLATNTDTSLYGTFDRIKVGSLQSLMVRTGSDAFAANSIVAGTTYSRGSVYDQNANPITATGLANSTFDAFKFSTTNGKITQNSSGVMTKVNVANASKNSDGDLNQFANLYLNYPNTKSAMTDGELPTSFPAPFNDENGNRLVDDSEFNAIMNAAEGSVTGGTVFGVASGSTYTGTGLPSASNSALSDLADGTYDGNLILTGTEANPIVIDGKIAVNGDLVLAGKVKGWGQIQVRGNAYVVGDTTYADAPGEFGQAADGTKNGMALVAGGNIIMGDYLTRTGLDKSGTSSVLSEYQAETRTKNKVVATGKDVGYYGAKISDPGFYTSSEPLTSFTTSELMQFNQFEYEKAVANSSYKPRYYRIRPSQPIYRNTGEDQCAFYYTDSGIKTVTTDSSTSILDLSPKNYWISEAQLRDIWWADEQTRPSSGRDFKFDGLLYSNNAIFTIVRSYTRHKSNTFGRMTIRGSIVCPDLGVLVPGKDDTTSRTALQMFYDRRVKSFFQIEDTTQASFRRLVYLARS